MEDVTLAHAKDHLEDLIARASRGEVIRISDEKLGTVRILADHAARAAAPSRVARKPGRLKGQMTVPKRLMEPMSDDELREWYGDDA